MAFVNAADRPSQSDRELPDLDTLDVQSLKALVLAQQAELDSRTTEIESLKLLILKLKRITWDRVRRSTITTFSSWNCGWKTWRATKPARRRLLLCHLPSH